MKFKLILASALLGASAFSIADAYQVDVGAAAVRADVNGVRGHVKSYEASGKYYFKLVKTDNVPLAEAAYLGKNSNAFVSYLKTHARGYRNDSEVYAGGLEVYIPENFLYIKVEGVHQDYASSSDTSVNTTFGLTPVDGLRLTTTWNSDESYHANLEAKYVTALGNGQYINVEAGLADTDFGTYSSLGGDYYFDNTFSVGAQISDDDLGTNYLVRTRKFFTDSFSGDVNYADTQMGNLVAVGVNYRF